MVRTVMSKVTSKGQTTIPKEVRDRLHVAAGDALVYEVQGNGAVMVRKARPFDTPWHTALSDTLEEWSSPEDEEAYRDL
jgi:AbrB family looped-hinge helix DNA binding protein